MSSSTLMALLTQQGGPALSIQKGLIVLCPQNDFLSPSGKLVVENAKTVSDRVAHLVLTFRDHGTIIWVRAEYDPSRSPVGADNVSTSFVSSQPRPSSSKGSSTAKTTTASQSHATISSNRKTHRRTQSKPDAAIVDPELFLSKHRYRGPCCLPRTTGANLAPSLEKIVDPNRDIQITTNDYSALQTTTLLQTLRMRFVTDVYLAGCVSNLSVYATALDAARYGLRITLIEDCLGYANLMRHHVAIRRLKTLIGAKTSSELDLIYKLRQKVDLTDDQATNSDNSGTDDDDDDDDDDNNDDDDDDHDHDVDHDHDDDDNNGDDNNDEHVSEAMRAFSPTRHLIRDMTRKSTTASRLPIGVDPRDRVDHANDDFDDDDDERNSSEDSDILVARTLRQLTARSGRQLPRNNTENRLPTRQQVRDRNKDGRLPRKIT